MNNTTHRVGKDILSFCNKCKLTLSHIIVSMMDNVSVGKVKCNTCKSVHKYKDPAASKVRKKKISGLLKKPTVNVHNVWEEAMKNSSTPPKPYNISEKFSQGDIIDHPKFGQGVVDGFLESDKIKVIFQSDQKTLLHNKKSK